MRERIFGTELERLLADNECLDSPFVHEYGPGKHAVDAAQLKLYRETRYRLIGYAPGQEPPMQ